MTGFCYRHRRVRPSSGVKAATWDARGASFHTLKKEELPVWHRAPSSGSTLRRALVSSPRTAAAPTFSSTTRPSSRTATVRWTRRSESSSRSRRAPRARRPTQFARSDQLEINATSDTQPQSFVTAPPGSCRGVLLLSGRVVPGPEVAEAPTEPGAEAEAAATPPGDRRFHV